MGVEGTRKVPLPTGELRYVEGELDEVVAQGVDVHLELLSDTATCLIIDWPGKEQLIVYIHSKNGRSHIEQRVHEVPGDTEASDG